MSVDGQKVYLAHRGTFKGHNGAITKIAVSSNRDDLLVSASRDKTLMVWKLSEEDGAYNGYAMKSLVGHNNFVTDCALSNDSRHAISSSWDGYLKMWDLETNSVRTLFRGHTGDVLSVGFSSDNRQIFSSARNGDIMLWNIVGQLKFHFSVPADASNQVVKNVILCVGTDVPLMVTGGADKAVRVWNYTTGQVQVVHYGHTNIVNSVDLTRSGQFTGSGGKDGIVNVWCNVTHQLCGSSQLPGEVSCVKFNPHSSLIAAACGSKIFILDVDKCKDGCLGDSIVDPKDTEGKILLPPHIICTSLAWSRDGRTLFAGYNDSIIRAFTIEPKPNLA